MSDEKKARDIARIREWEREELYAEIEECHSELTMLREEVRGLEEMIETQQQCAWRDPLHDHHDGCPSEYVVEEENRRLKSQLADADTKYQQLVTVMHLAVQKDMDTRIEETKRHSEEVEKLQATIARWEPLVKAAMAYCETEIEADHLDDERYDCLYENLDAAVRRVREEENDGNAEATPADNK